VPDQILPGGIIGNAGLTSIMVANSAGWYPFKNSAVRNPAGKICFAEEPTDPPNDTPPPDSPPARTGELTIEDGCWRPPSFAGFYTTLGHSLTTRHDGNADVGFVDSHVSAVNWTFATNIANTMPGY
jgi:prepilin-type processing-associated H-X9-DG protein